MKFRKYSMFVLGMMIPVLSGSFSVRAQENTIQFTDVEMHSTGVSEASSEESISPYADTIVYKYRMLDGVLQYRRWNETKQCWVDATWIDVA